MKREFHLSLLLTGLLGLLMQADELPQSKAPGLGLGEPAPAFILMDQDGKSRVASEIYGKGISALVFMRSADW